MQQAGVVQQLSPLQQQVVMGQKLIFIRLQLLQVWVRLYLHWVQHPPDAKVQVL